MIDFGLGAIDISHIGVPVDNAGDGLTLTAKLGQQNTNVPTTSLHINNNVYEGTIYDKNLWSSPPNPDDSDKVCGWVHDMAAAEPRSVCEQWSSDDWNSWVDHYEDQDCGIPKCGENYPAQLIPYDQSAPADAAAAAQLNPAVQTQLAPAALQTDLCSLKDQRSKPSNPRRKTATPKYQQADPGEEFASAAADLDASHRVSRATPAHFVLSLHALFLAAIENLIKGGDEASFKRDALSNAAAVSPVGEALLTSHFFNDN